MSTRNRKRLAKMLSKAYDGLDTDDVRRILDEADRTMRGDGRYVLVDSTGEVQRLDFADDLQQKR